MAERPGRQVRFIGVRKAASSPAVEVEMRRAGTVFRASAPAEPGDNDVVPAARAAVAALRELGHSVTLDQVEEVDVLGYPSVAVRLRAEHNNERRELVGFCVKGSDPPRAGALAVLNATNRFLDIG